MLEVNVLRSTRIHAMALLKYIVLLNTDVPRSARFYAHGLGLAVTVCSERWAELQSGAFRIALMQAPKGTDPPARGYSPFLSFDIDDMEGTVTRLLSMGAELDGSIKYAPHGKVAAVRCLDGHMLGLFEPAETKTKPEKFAKPGGPAPAK